MGSTDLNFLDLFSGAGGLTLGFHNAKWESIFAIDRDKMSWDTFSTNFLDENTLHGYVSRWPAWLDKRNHDVLDILASSKLVDHVKGLKGIDAVIGGPPCQGFSAAGKRIADDPRNQLPAAFCRFVDLVKPRLFLMENVEGITHILTNKNGVKSSLSTAEAIVNEMELLNYRTEFKLLNALDFGVPQERWRTVILGVNKDEKLDLDSFWTNTSSFASSVRKKYELGDLPITVGEAISDLDPPELVPCPDAKHFMTSPYKEPTAHYQKVMRRGLKSGSLPDSHRYPNHGETVRKRFELIQQMSRFGRQPKTMMRSLGEYSTRKHKIHWLDPAKPATTITSQPGDFLHPTAPRELTVREMARLQSFPDTFKFRGRYTINGPRRPYDTARCTQVGNAVPPLMAEGIAIGLTKLLN